MITIDQLQAAYKAINGVEAGDVHRLRASYMFGVPYLAVTEEQRAIGKKENYPQLYSIPRALNLVIQSVSSDKEVHKNVRRYKHVTDWSFRPSV